MNKDYERLINEKTELLQDLLKYKRIVKKTILYIKENEYEEEGFMDEVVETKELLKILKGVD